MIWKRVIICLTAILFVLILLSTVSSAGECKECHSKNPKLVEMHKALGFKGCMDCHAGGQFTFSKERLDARGNDPLCARCHK